MAVSLGFGVLFATLITLVLVPTAYMILDDVGRTMRRVLGGYRPAPDVGVNRSVKSGRRPRLCGDAYGVFSSGQGLYVTTAAGRRPGTPAARRCGTGPGESATE